ncbi:MAG: TonB-dependent receptor, partial [Proteobacteria bacterium]|nr:TonB-dependent receptor [Pseudomonadota bacterium]
MLICVLTSSAATAASSSGSAGDAVVSIYVFKQGVPVGGADVVADGRTIGLTNNHGSLHVLLREGWHDIVVSHQGAVVKQLNLKLKSDERIRIILAQPSPDYPASTDIESSEGTKIIGGANSASKLATTDKGMISGMVTSLESKAPLPGVRVFISGVSGAVKTDTEGKYETAVPVGKYSVSFVHPEFSTQIYKDIVVTKDQATTKSTELTPAGEDLGEFVVNAPTVEGGYKALADERRQSSSVKDVIGAKQMSNAGASDAAGALKRVTGLTLVDGKYIFIRGLGERYSSVLLNNASLPSPDPTRRVVPLDLFPTGVLSGVVIQKTYSPDMPGDFSGGVVQLRTLGELAEEPESNISVQLKYNSNTTFKEGLVYEGGSTDYLGIDDGGRQLPGLVDAETDGGVKPGELSEQAAESFPQIYNTTPSTLPPGIKLKMLFSDIFEPLDSDYGWGYNLALNYENDWKLKDEIRNTYSGDGAGGVVLENEVDREQTENEINLGGLLNFIFEAGESHRFESNTILTRQSTKSVIVDNGYLSENDINVRDTTLEWRETQLFSQQFRGEHSFSALNDLELDWHATLSQALRDVPFTRFYRYVENSGVYSLTTDNVHQIRYESLEDNTADFALNLTYPIYDLFGSFTKIKMGVSSISKDRESQTLRFNWISPITIDPDILKDPNPENIFTDANIGADGFSIFNGTQPTDNYVAKQTLSAAYLMTEVEANDKWSFMAGARIEDNNQNVTTFELSNPDESVVGEIISRDVLPAASVTWAFNKKMQLRAAASATVNRPDFKELSKAPYIDPVTRDIIIGNPELEQANIT